MFLIIHSTTTSKLKPLTHFASKHFKKFHSKLATHSNPLIANQAEQTYPIIPPIVKKALMQGFTKPLTPITHEGSVIGQPPS